MSDEDIGEFRIIKTTVLEAVEQVRIYDETIAHMGEEHKELRNFIPSLEHAVHDTISNPTAIHQSNIEIHTNSYKFCSNNHTKGNNQLVVAVKVVEGKSGLLKTAYFTGSVTGNVVWSRSDD